MSTASDIDTEILLFMEEEFEEPKCQADHSIDELEIPATLPCKIVAVARKTVGCSGLSFRICINSVVWNMEVFKLQQLCPHCQRLCSECWDISPI